MNLFMAKGYESYFMLVMFTLLTFFYALTLADKSYHFRNLTKLYIITYRFILIFSLTSK